MDLSIIRILLIEHSNAARCIQKALKTRGEEQKRLVQTAVEHLELVNEAGKDIPPESVPEGIYERNHSAITSLKNGDVEKGWEILLEMGRMFDDFRRQ